MLVHRRVTPSIKFAGSHLYTRVERGTVSCPRTQRNVPDQYACSEVERTNHEATAPPSVSPRCRQNNNFRLFRPSIVRNYIISLAHRRCKKDCSRSPTRVQPGARSYMVYHVINKRNQTCFVCLEKLQNGKHRGKVVDSLIY